jgi:branched-chain amino acid transport system substrate-binding protein
MLSLRRSLQQYSTLLILAIVTAVSLFLLAMRSGYSQDLSPPDRIVIGMSAAFKGSAEGLGTELYRGSMAYLEEVNRNGGVHGKKIVLAAKDDGYNPNPAIYNTIDLIEKDRSFLLFNYVGTPTVTRMLPLLRKYRDRNMYLFFPFTGAQPHREAPYNKYVFNLRASYRQETEGLVDNFVAKGLKNIAVFYQIDAYGRSGWDGVKRALSQYNLNIVGEATYRRGTKYDRSMNAQVEILKRSHPDAIISIGAYEACAAFIRDARDAGLDVPIANVSFVGSENLLNLLLQTNQQNGKDYTQNLINSQVVPSYEDTSLSAVREYRQLMDRYSPMPPKNLAGGDYQALNYSFVSFEGFLNAKLLVEILSRMDENPRRSEIQSVVEAIENFDLGIDVPISFDVGKHQGLDRIYYTTVRDRKFIPLPDWNSNHHATL